MSKTIPAALTGHILPFRWDVRKVWALEAPAHQIACSDFAYLLELPLWSSAKGKGLLFDLCPQDVIRDASLSSFQSQRLKDVKLDYPIDVLIFQERRWILDGVHRIAKHLMLNIPTLPVRFHEEAVIQLIKVD